MSEEPGAGKWDPAMAPYEGASLCGVVWGVVELLVAWGVRSRRSPAWCSVLPYEEESELIQKRKAQPEKTTKEYEFEMSGEGDAE